MEKICQWEENLLYFRDQVAYSHQNHEMTRQTNHSEWKNENTDSPPDTKSAEQSDENISRWESFKKGKEKPIGERQKAYKLTQKFSDGELQGFVSGIVHHESKRLYEKCASSPDLTQTSWWLMCLAKWFNAVFNDNFPKFGEWSKGYSKRNAASEICSEFIYLCWRLWSPCSSLYFANEKLLLKS